MRTIHQGHLPIRTLVLIGMVILITAQAYAQNANARLTITLRNATLKEFVKLIENSTGYSFIYSEEISISHKINLKVKDMPLHEILDLVFKDEPSLRSCFRMIPPCSSVQSQACFRNSSKIKIPLFRLSDRSFF